MLIGKGTYSKVYAYKDENVWYAVKKQLYYTHKLQICPLREIDIQQKCSECSRINHIHKVRVLNSHVYSYLDLEQNSLWSLIHKKRLSSAERQAIFPQVLYDILYALCFLEQKNILHLDIKPANILQTNGRFYLADFGLSQIDFPGVEIKSEVVTQIYRSPELLEKTRRLDKVDVWAFGITMYELLTGSFICPIDSSIETIKLVHDLELPGLLENLEYDPYYLNVLNNMLIKDPNLRSSATELLFSLGLNFPVISARKLEKNFTDQMYEYVVLYPNNEDYLPLCLGIDILSRYSQEITLDIISAVYYISCLYVNKTPAAIFGLPSITVQTKLLLKINFIIFDENLFTLLVSLYEKFPDRTQITEYLKSLEPNSLWLLFK